MTRLTNSDFAKRELSTGELETVAAGVALMSGAPNSIQISLIPREPRIPVHMPPHYPLEPRLPVITP